MSFCPNCGHDLGPTSSEASAEERLLTPSEAAQLMAVPVRTLDGWRNRSIGPKYLKVGRHVRYRSSDLSAWLETRGGDDR